MPFFGILAIVFIFLRLPSLFEPYWYGDEGIYLTIGQALNQGVALYGRIHDNKPPSLYYLAALGQTVFGFRFLLLLWMIPTIFVFYKFCSLFFKSNLTKILTLLFTIITSIPLIEGHIANAEIFMLLPTILAVYLVLHKPVTGYRLLITGLLFGLAFTIKVPVAIEFGLICLWLIYQNLFINKMKSIPLKKIIILTFGFLLPITLYFLYSAYQGFATNFLYSALLQNFGYLSSWTSGTHSGSATQGGLMTRLVILLLFWLTLGFLNFKKILSPKIFFILCWAGATVFGALLSNRPYPHYLIQTIPPALLLLGFIFDRSRLAKFVTILFFVGYLFIIIAGKFYTYQVFPYYSNFYQYIFGFKTAIAYRQYFGARVEVNQDISKYLHQNTTPQDKIFIWGDEPSVYAQSNRLPSSRFTVAYHILDFNGYQETLDQLQIYLPKFIVIYPMNNRPYPQLEQFVQKYYFLQHQFQDILVFQLR